jgi:hypothetical protein
MIAGWILAGCAIVTCLILLGGLVFNTGKLINRFDNHIANTSIHVSKEGLCLFSHLCFIKIHLGM